MILSVISFVLTFRFPVNSIQDETSLLAADSRRLKAEGSPLAADS
jgi:hypothetical protein